LPSRARVAQSYEQTRPWAKAIKEAVSLRKMPPWFADPTRGHFTNDRSLRRGEIDTLTKWADSGAHEGKVEDAPPVVQLPDGRVIQPDIIVPGSVFDVPAKTKNNVVEWMDVVVPSDLVKRLWLRYAICLALPSQNTQLAGFQFVFADSN
jgi:hypothetical protein